ncbi:MAG: CdaR family protein [Desulfobaccales bacterium]|nr:CdaR family protein [Desulfobaccales bacterium]
MSDWRTFLGRNRGLKLLALGLAVALWFAVGSEERTETTLNLALELANLPPKMIITSEVPASLQVRAIGPASVVRKLTQTRLVHTIDLSGYKSGRHSFSLGPNSFSFPRGVTVTRIQPNPLKLTLAVTTTRTLPIKPVLEGRPPDGYEVTEVKTRPDQITIKGPAPELADLKFVPTLPIDLTNISGSTTVATDVDFKNLHLTVQEQISILADLTIEAREATRTIPGVPVEARPRAARLSPSQVTLTLQGPGLRLKDLKPKDLKATVDTQNLGTSRRRLKVAVSPPSGVRLLKVQPDTVTAQGAK